MTVALANHVNTLNLPAERGVSVRACREVLRMMAKIANDAGDFKYGLRGVKLVELTGYSLSVVRRAQRYLVDHGFVERLQVGGGRRSTKWRLIIGKPESNRSSRHNSSGEMAQQQDRHDTAQAPTPSTYPGMDQKAPPVAPQRNVKPWEASATVHSLINRPLCEHGFPLGTTSKGTPKCPTCRKKVLPQLRQQTAEIIRRKAPRRPDRDHR